MTNRVDRLERARPGRAQPDPTDRRGVIVRLTPAGMAVVDSAMADLLARERDLLAELGDHERAELAGLLRRLLAPFERELTRCADGRRLMR